MGNRTRVNAVRQGINIQRKSNIRYDASFWCCERQDMPLFLYQDRLIRNVIMDFVKKDEGLRYILEKIEINRNTSGSIFIKIYCAKPGKFVGDESANIKKLEEIICKRLVQSGLYVVVNQKAAAASGPRINISVVESFRPEANPKLIANEIVKIMIARGNYTKYIRSVISKNSKSKFVRGIRIQTAGRLSGAAIARSETNATGLMGLSSFNRNIEQALGVAHTVKGACSVRVTIDMGGNNA